MEHTLRTLGACLLLAALAGCEPLSLAALGIGGSAAVNHKVSSTPSRTFTAPIAKVRSASLLALTRMGIKADGVSRQEGSESIKARAGKRTIEVELEAVTAHTTRMQVVARDGGLLYDGSTANEIIAQTGKNLGV
jgi:hypothetical protein